MLADLSGILQDFNGEMDEILLSKKTYWNGTSFTIVLKIKENKW
jgi:hypothetical protein